MAGYLAAGYPANSVSGAALFQTKQTSPLAMIYILDTVLCVRKRPLDSQTERIIDNVPSNPSPQIFSYSYWLPRFALCDLA